MVVVQWLRKATDAVGRTIDLRDCFVFGGIAMMGYGLWMYRPWVSLAVCGAILTAIGVFVGRGKG